MPLNNGSTGQSTRSTDGLVRTYLPPHHHHRPGARPADELARLSAQRWEIETTCDELKIHRKGPGLVLRSQIPDGVIQEAYGHLFRIAPSEPRRVRCSPGAGVGRAP